MNTAGVEGNGSSQGPSVSADGRYVAFDSNASVLIVKDTNSAIDVFVRNQLTGVTKRISENPNGVGGNIGGLSSSISADGQLVAFTSSSTNLVDDTNYVRDVFVRIESGLIFLDGFEWAPWYRLLQ